MIFIAGVGSRIKPSGNAACTCPACGKSVSLHLCKRYNIVTLFFVPLVPFGANYLATCPSCASVLGVDAKQGRLVERKPGADISPDNLEIVQNNAALICNRCGGRVEHEQNFCPTCGYRL